MPVQKFATADEIPEALRSGALALADGTFAVIEGASEDEGPKALIEDLRTKLKAAEFTAKKALAEAKSRETETKAKDAGLSAEALQKIREEVRADVMKEIEPDLTRGTAALQENRALKLDGKVRAIALSNGVRAERIDHWWNQFRDHFDLTDDGQAPIVKDKAGTKLETYISDVLKKELPDFYVGTQGAGGGARGDTGAAPIAGNFTVADVLKNPAAVMTAGRAKSA